MLRSEYKKEISKVLNCSEDQIFLYWKGRVALFAALKSMNIKEGDEVIIQAFTCVVVPNAVIYTGAKPVYVDIDPHTLNMDVNELKKKINSKTKAIICQNTFGLSSNLEELVQIAREYNLYTIEDCTHGFGGYYNGRPNGSYCDAAFYSTQWNKPFSTGIGGFLVVNNMSLLEGVKAQESKKNKPGYYETFLLYLLLVFRKYFINKYTHNMFVGLYRLLSRFNIVVGSNSGEETENISIPKGYFKDISFVQSRNGLKQIRKIHNINQLRKRNAADYTKYLSGINKSHVHEKFFENHLFLKYPLLVTDREKFVSLAQRENIILGDWFFSPIYPIKSGLEKWFYNEELYPVAREISKKIVNLPTEVKNNSRIISFLEKQKKLIDGALRMP